MTLFLISALALGCVLSLSAWTLRPGAPVQLLLVAMTVLAGAVPAIVVTVSDPGVDAGAIGWLHLVGGLLAVTGGGPLTMAVLWLVDQRSPTNHGSPDSMQNAGKVLRGGAWIGALERIAVFASLVAGWPEGVAVVLAVKGLGRYPELRSPGAAERFIIGTLVSVLWAAACAGVSLG